MTRYSAAAVATVVCFVGNAAVFFVGSCQAQTFSTLASFTGTNGATPTAALVQGTDGNFYGTTSKGGVHGYGTIFKITSGGALTTLYSFCSKVDCADGANPAAGLIQAEGNFYGTTSYGGVSN